MLHLDAYWIFYLLLTEKLEARDAGDVFYGVFIVLSKDLLILKGYQMLVLNPLVYLIKTFAATFSLVPLIIAGFKHYANVLLLNETLTAIQRNFLVKAV